MGNARQEAREVVQTYLDDYGVISTGPADAASDIWESIAKTLRVHTPIYSKQENTHNCWKCKILWPCPDWKQASEALDG